MQAFSFLWLMHLVKDFRLTKSGRAQTHFLLFGYELLKCRTVPHLQLSDHDNTVRGSMSPWWITGSTLWVKSNFSCCMSSTFLSCSRCSRLKLCRRHSLTLIPLISQTDKLVCLLIEPCGRNVACTQLYHFALPSFHRRYTSTPHFIRLPPPPKSHPYHSTIL